MEILFLTILTLLFVLIHMLYTLRKANKEVDNVRKAFKELLGTYRVSQISYKKELSKLKKK